MAELPPDLPPGKLDLRIVPPDEAPAAGEAPPPPAGEEAGGEKPDPHVKAISPKQAAKVRALHEQAQEAEIEMANQCRRLGELTLLLEEARQQADKARTAHGAAVQAREEAAARVLRTHNLPAEQWYYDLGAECLRRRPFLAAAPLLSGE